MTHNDVRVFLSVVRNGSLSQTAEAMGTSVSALGKHIDALENEYNAQLIERGRGKRGVTLTDSGRAFVNLAHQWDKEWSELEESFHADLIPRFNIAASKSIYKYILSEIHATFHDFSSQLNLVVTTPSINEAFTGLCDGTINLALYSECFENQYITALPVYSEDVVLLCSIGSTYPDEVCTKELEHGKEIFLGYDGDTSWGRSFSLWHDYWFSGKQPLLTSDNSTHVSEFINSFGPNVWCVTPVSIANEIVKSGTAEKRVLTDPPYPRTAYALFANSEIYSPYSELFLRCLCKQLKDRPGFRLLI